MDNTCGSIVNFVVTGTPALRVYESTTVWQLTADRSSAINKHTGMNAT